MMERLCFGTFIDVLTTCRLKTYDKTPIVVAVIRTIDPETKYANIDNKDTDSISNNDIYRSLNHLYKCTGDFTPQYSSILELAPKADAKTVCQKFEQNVVPYIDMDKYTLLVLALCDIIRKDQTLDYEKGGENIKKFERYVGKDVKSLINNSEYILSEFLSGIFLYTINGIQNSAGKEWLRFITSEYKKYKVFFETYINIFIDQKNTIKVFASRDQKEKSIVNSSTIDAEITAPKQCKVCFYCENWKSNIKAVHKYTNNIYGICNLHNKNTLSSENCPCFLPNYGRMTSCILFKK